MSLLKPAGITGLNTGDALYSDLVTLWEIGQNDKDLVSDTALGTTRAVAADADIGDCRAYNSGAIGDFSQTIAFAKGASYTWIYKTLQGYGPKTTLMDAATNFNQAEFYIDRASSASVRLDQRYGAGSTATTQWHPFSSDALMDAPNILTLTIDAGGTPALYVNGSVVAPNGGSVAANADTPDSSPIPHSVLTEVESADNFYLGAVIKHDKVLSAGEVSTFHGDPWAAVSFAGTPSITLTNGDLEPGKAMTGTASNFTSAPTALTATDADSNSISSASEITDLVVTSTGGDSYDIEFTMPARITSGTGTTLLRGPVTLELT